VGVKGDTTIADDLTIVWSFVLEGNPPLVGISVPTNSAIPGKQYVSLELLKKHGEFTLNVPDESWIIEFDNIDMTASTAGDKFFILLLPGFYFIPTTVMLNTPVPENL